MEKLHNEVNNMHNLPNGVSVTEPKMIEHEGRMEKIGNWGWGGGKTHRHISLK
jgi:hypothetical protein